MRSLVENVQKRPGKAKNSLSLNVSLFSVAMLDSLKWTLVRTLILLTPSVVTHPQVCFHASFRALWQTPDVAANAPQALRTGETHNVINKFIFHTSWPWMVMKWLEIDSGHVIIRHKSDFRSPSSFPHQSTTHHFPKLNRVFPTLYFCILSLGPSCVPDHNALCVNLDGVLWVLCCSRIARKGVCSGGSGIKSFSLIYVGQEN